MTQTRRIRVGLAVIAALIGIGGLHALSRSLTFQLLGEVVPRVDTDERVVALTFDDGPRLPDADDVLASLARERVPATFFLVGRDVDAEPGAARRIAAGHEIGNHSYSHRKMVLVSPAWVRRELEATDAAMRRSGYTGPIHFRPPYRRRLLALPLVLWHTGRVTVMWDVEAPAEAAEGRTAVDPATIAAQVVDRVRPGSIVVLHVMTAIREPTRRALPLIIAGLMARGYRFLTVSGMLSLRSAAIDRHAVARPTPAGARSGTSRR